ncbi:MAG: hypothetical protein GX318_00775, partial [Clostridia bacterium]|nr:hypothetical protein [Clostridia bacterium]
EMPEIKINRVIKEVVKPGTTYEDDPEIEAGKEFIKYDGKDGFRILVERDLRKNGKLIGQEVISEDYYPPEDRIILRGVGKPLQTYSNP